MLRMTLPERPSSSKVFAAFGYILFVFSGINTTTLSILAPHLNGTITDAGIGQLFAAQLTGQLLGPLFLFGRPLLSLAVGLLTTCCCCLYITQTHSLGLPAVALYGFGLGLVMASTNTFVGAISDPAHIKSRIELLNFFWPIGAVSAPLVSLVFGWRSISAPFSFVLANSALALLCSIFLSRSHRLFALRVDTKDAAKRSRPRMLLLLCLLAALAGGIESGLYSWTPILAQRFTGFSHAAEMGAILFWVGSMSGRLTASFVVTRYRDENFAVIAAWGATVSIFASAVGWTGYSLLCFLFLAGACVAPIYPSLISDALALRGSQFIFVSAGVGGAALPWLMGRLSTVSGSLRWSMALPCAACALLAASLHVTSRSKEKVN